MTGRLASWRRLGCGAVAAISLAWANGAASAQEPVDVELVLAVDVSLSMSPEELEIQRAGYAAALLDNDVIQAIEDGLHGRIAVTYFEWAGDTVQRVVVPWTIIASREHAEAVVAQLTATPPISARRTSISGALSFAADLFAESGMRGMRRVIDISGDGPNNQGSTIEPIRNEIVGQGITINGLPLMTDGGLTSAYDVQDLDLYYASCVIGGPGAFVIPVNGWSQFPEAVRRKLVLELAEAPPPSLKAGKASFPPVVKAQAPAYDCLIGERLWNNRNWMYRTP